MFLLSQMRDIDYEAYLWDPLDYGSLIAGKLRWGGDESTPGQNEEEETCLRDRLVGHA